jgi:subfamily B ATP-binding cassette protein MsbA
VSWAPLFVLGVHACKTTLEYLQTYWIGVAGDGICRDIRDAVRAPMQLPLTYFARNPTPAVVARVISDVGMVQSVVSTSLLTTLKDAFSIVALGSLLVYQDWRMALLSLVVLPGAVSARALRTFRRRRVRLEQECLGDLSVVAHESVAGNKIVKAFWMEAYEGAPASATTASTRCGARCAIWSPPAAGRCEMVLASRPRRSSGTAGARCCRGR